MKDDYKNLEYRNLIAWSTRIEREWPFLMSHLADAPMKSIVDLGCGPGEHLARFAAEGWRTLGIDASLAMIESAREHHSGLEFVHGDMARVAELQDEEFGAAICLGNVVASIEDDTFRDGLFGLSRRLAPGGRVIFQQLEAATLLSGERRHIGPNFRPPTSGDADEEDLFLRVWAPSDREGWARFYPIRMTLSATDDVPVRLESAKRIEHRLRSHEEVVTLFEEAGLVIDRLCGDVQGGPHDPTTSPDLWVLASTPI